MEKTIKSLNIVAAALLIVNLAVELWDRIYEFFSFYNYN